MKKMKLCSSVLAMSAATLFSQTGSAQEFGAFEYPENINLIGLGVASVPDFYGSDKNQGAAVPLLHYTFAGNRYIQLLGLEAKLNLIDSKEFRAGPVLRGRTRRDEDVDNEVVQRMTPVASATELGAFAEYHYYPNPSDRFHKVVFGADVVGNTTDVYSGATGNLRVNYFYPFSQSWTGGRLVIGSIGLGMFFASKDFNTSYFGVTGSDVALFPSLGGSEYRPDSGITSIKIPFSISTQLDKKWMLTAGGRYEHLLGDAKDSPVVTEQGNKNQWSLGIGVSYLF